jgi:hypothetical protein
MRYALYFALGGAILGAALTAWFAPGVIAWYFNPPVEMGGFSCTVPIQWALRRLQWAQLWGVVVGGVLGLIVYGVVQRRRVRKLEHRSSGPEAGSSAQMPESLFVLSKSCWGTREVVPTEAMLGGGGRQPRRTLLDLGPPPG